LEASPWAYVLLQIPMGWSTSTSQDASVSRHINKFIQGTQGLFWLSPSAQLHFKRFHKSNTSNHQDAKVGCILQRFLLPKMKEK
jgi:hypothetical protein